LATPVRYTLLRRQFRREVSQLGRVHEAHAEAGDADVGVPQRDAGGISLDVFLLGAAGFIVAFVSYQIDLLKF